MPLLRWKRIYEVSHEVAYEIFREIRRLGNSSEPQRIVTGAHPTVTKLLQEDEQQGLEDLERRYAVKIIVIPDESCIWSSTIWW